MKHIDGICEILGSKKAILCDLWGVLHDGSRARPGAIEVLENLNEAGLKVILLSNSPKPIEVISKQIEGFGIRNTLIFDIVSSGRLAREFLSTTPDKSYFFIGTERDRLILKGLKNPETQDLREANYILCTGFFEDWGSHPVAYEAFLLAGVENKIPLICANPDKEVDIGEKRVLCAGTLASFYEQLGGLVIWLGKPENVAYKRAFEVLGDKFGKGEILAIGDSLETDIKGASNFGIESIFITSGLHGFHDPDPENIKAEMTAANIFSEYFMERLKW